VIPEFDILGLGCTALDELLYVEAYPPADGKERVHRRERQCGGLTATALVAAARLGAKCAYAGALGQDEQSRFVLRCLQRENIDISHAVRRASARPIQSVIIVDKRRKTRTVFYDSRQVKGADSESPAPELIRSTRVLLVDNFGLEGMARAARLARTAGIPVVGDFESNDGPGFSKLLRLVDHLVLSEAFACTLTGAKDPGGAIFKLWNRDRQVVIVTCGAKGCCYSEVGSNAPKFVPAFRVKALDTTGCGDVFHGAYALALARNLELTERIRFASAAAALKATRHGGQAGIPTLAVVERFLKQFKP
jgi:sulfofructose kinase